MFKRIIAVVLLLLCAHAHAALPDDYRVVLLTENFPPFNMAEDGKNYAADARIHGINADIVREMFRRTNIRYELTLRFPWERRRTQDDLKADSVLAARYTAAQAHLR